MGDTAGGPHLAGAGYFGVGLGQGGFFLGRPRGLALQLERLLLGLLVVHPLGLTFLDRLADRSNGVAGVGSGPQDALLDQTELFDKVGLELGVGRLELEGALELEGRSRDGVAGLAIRGADDGIVQALILGEYLQLAAGEGVPRVLPHLGIVDNLDRLGQRGRA